MQELPRQALGLTLLQRLLEKFPFSSTDPNSDRLLGYQGTKTGQAHLPVKYFSVAGAIIKDSHELSGAVNTLFGPPQTRSPPPDSLATVRAAKASQTIPCDSS